MSKYTGIKSTPGNDVAWMLQNIANEMAEKNRLKRYELGVTYVKGALVDKA